MPRLFGTDGIRAVAGEHPLDRATIWRIGRALALAGWTQILVGRDTRSSGTWIEAWLNAGVQAGGGGCTSVGVITTPGLACLTSKGDFDAGVMISASHNPYQDNGIKIFSRSGAKLDDEAELSLEQGITKQMAGAPQRVETEKLAVADYLHQDYLAFLKGSVDGNELTGLKIAIDAANGAGFQLAPQVFRSLGTTVLEMATSPNGSNINERCGALHPEGLSELVTRCGCDLGLALDGDADRAILVNSEGSVVDGDHLLLILARDMLRRGWLTDRAVVGTVMANMGLEVALRREGIDLIRTQVGDRYVLKEMHRGKHDLGGEQSGHIILRQISSAGDGILVGLQIASIMVSQGRSLSQLTVGLEKFPQTLINVPVREKPDFMRIPQIRTAIQAAEGELGSQGKVLIRYSGTEPKVRVMVEGPNLQLISRLGETIANLFREELG